MRGLQIESQMDFTSVGVGGIFVLLVLKEVLAFLGKPKNGNGNGAYVRGMRNKPNDYSVEFDELMRIVRELDDERELRIQERLETNRLLREIHHELVEQRRRA